MALTPGTRLGPYEVLTPVGAGGMGEVYRARDTKLDRPIALKILPESVAHDPERIARFDREARTLASLNHANITIIHDFEEANGIKALVMDLVERPTLADRIAQGPIPIDEALPIASQIADALEAAHEHGIIHRDLKPANSKLKPAPAGIVSTLVVRRIDVWGAAVVSAGLPLILHDAVTLRTTFLLVGIALLYWFGYTINDYFDAPFDACDDDKARANFFVLHHVSARVLAVVGLALTACLFGVFATFGIQGLGLFALANLAMWGYSAPPIRLKSRPGLDLLAHGVFVLTFPYFVALLLIDASWTRLDWLLLGLNFLASFGGQLSQQIRDFDVDSRTDLNFTTTFGITTSILWLRVTTVVTILISVAAITQGVIPVVVIPLGIVCLPVLFNRVTARPGRKPSARLYNSLAMAALAYSTAIVCNSLLK